MRASAQQNDGTVLHHVRLPKAVVYPESLAFHTQNLSFLLDLFINYPKKRQI